MTSCVHTVKATQLWFTAPFKVEIREHALPAPGPEQVLVKTQYSAPSSGTELLLYRGQIPQAMALDATLDALQHQTRYPLQYGYACVGQVVQTGSKIDSAWQSRQVFAFQPHASHFIARPEQLIEVPAGITPDGATFLANMETAINLVQDGNPLIGERVVVVGQGVVGLLLASVLAQFPLASLSTLDALSCRRRYSLQLGASQSYDPAVEPQLDNLHKQLGGQGGGTGADLVYEVSGRPDALDLAVACCGFASRLVIGSWYGNKTAPVALGGEAHRNRLQIMTSQVSTLAPALSGRWDKARRFSVAWDMISKIRPEQLITHRVAISDAALLYQQLDEGAPAILQALFHYPD